MFSRDVHELWQTRHVARGKDSWIRRPQCFVDDDLAARTSRHAHGAEAEAIRIRSTTGRHEYRLCANLLTPRGRINRDDNFSVLSFDPADRGVRPHHNAFVGEYRRQRRGNLWLLEGGDTRERFHQRHVGSQARKELSQFQAHGVSADHHHRGGYVAQLHGRRRREVVNTVETLNGWHPRRRTRRNDVVISLDCLTVHFHEGTGHELGVPKNDPKSVQCG